MILIMKRIVVLSEDTKDFWIRALYVIYPLGPKMTGYRTRYFANPIRRRPRVNGHRNQRGTAPKVEILDIIDN